MATVYFTSLATRDIYENSEFVSRENTKAAFRLIEKIKSTCELLAANPGMGEVYQAKSCECRLFSSGRYVIFFRNIDDGIQVLRIVRGERDFKNVL